MKIASISAYQIFDSRGRPTVEAELVLAGGACGYGAVPSGASKGQFEALELRDGDPRRFGGKSVFNAIAHVNQEIAAALRGWDLPSQRALDERLIQLDATADKSRLGANALLAVSMAGARALACAQGVPLYVSLGGNQGNLLPLPEIQIIGGGAHANGRTDVQDFLVVAVGAKDYGQTLEITHNVYHAAGELLKQRGSRFGVADEGGFWPDFQFNEQAIQFLVQAIASAGYTPGVEAAISLDIAASDLFDAKTGRYTFKLEGRSFSSPEFADLMVGWCERYPIISIEDPMADTDWEGWSLIAQALCRRIQIVGDDLFTTNAQRIRMGIQRKIANAVLIKLNQIGTVSQSMDAIRLTQEAGWLPIVSARSGETEDAFISHLAVAANAGQLKVGSFARGERMAKWNEVLRIQRHLGARARFLGGEIFRRIREETVS